MISIIDYGVGNLFSLKASLKSLNLDCIVTKNIDEIESSERIILPGVGAFEDAFKKLSETGLVPYLKETKKPILGICLGMQMLFDESYEYGVHKGLELIGGKICPIAEDVKGLKVPHMGWNSLDIKKSGGIFKYVSQGEYVYYVHSYYGKECSEDTTATSMYGVEITGAVQRGNVYGTQFHPEKSGETGLKILRAYSEIK